MANVIQKRLAELKSVDSTLYYNILDELNNSRPGNIVHAVEKIREMIDAENERRAMRGNGQQINVAF